MQPRPATRRPAPPPASVFLLAAVLAATACATPGGGAAPVTDGQERPDHVAIRVMNNAWSAIHVYVVAGGQWQSLGVLSSQSTEDYTVAWSRLGGRNEIRLVADPVGSTEGYFSDPILVQPGDLVEWTLQNNLALSSVSVR